LGELAGFADAVGFAGTFAFAPTPDLDAAGNFAEAFPEAPPDCWPSLRHAVIVGAGPGGPTVLKGRFTDAAALLPSSGAARCPGNSLSGICSSNVAVLPATLTDWPKAVALNYARESGSPFVHARTLPSLPSRNFTRNFCTAWSETPRR